MLMDMECIIVGLLAAIRAEPHDRTHRMILGDALDDAGDRRADIVRTIQPEVRVVMERLGEDFLRNWNNGYILRRTGEYRSIKPVRLISGWIEGRERLIPAAVARAIEIERGLAVLRLMEEDV